MNIPLRQLGRTQLQVSLLGLGGLGILSKHQNTPASATRLIHAALDSGINFIDTARSYGDSENRIGLALRHRRTECILASKTMARSYVGARKDLEASLRALQTDHIELYQIHHLQWHGELEQVFAENGALQALKEAQQAGWIGYIGITAHLPDLAVAAMATGCFDAIQAPLNPLDAPLFSEIFRQAERRQLGVIVMKPLAGGLLANHAELALRYCLAEKVHCLIPGMSTLAQLYADRKHVLAAKPLTPSESSLLLEAAEAVAQNQCRRCGYCLSVCPEQIPIMEIFRFERYLDIYKTGHWAKNQYHELSVRADQCRDCGRCEVICPYRLPIRRMLAAAHKKLCREITTVEYAYHGANELSSEG